MKKEVKKEGRKVGRMEGKEEERQERRRDDNQVGRGRIWKIVFIKVQEDKEVFFRVRLNER